MAVFYHMGKQMRLFLHYCDRVDGAWGVGPSENMFLQGPEVEVK